MTTEFNELLPVAHDEKAQLWIIGTRDQVQHLINECYVRKLTTDRADFTPIVPAPIVPGKFMAILMR